MRTEGDHNQVSENVFDNLPQWQRELWKGVRGPFIETYSWYPDTLAPINSPEAMSKAEPRYKDIMYIDGRFAQEALACESSPFSPFGRSYGERPADRIIEPPQFKKVFGFYLDMMVRSLRTGDYHTAAKAAGIVSHILCDHHPGDHIDVPIWQGVLVPPPPDAKVVPDCWAITGQTVDIPRVLYTPQLLGQTPPEAMFRFYQRYLSVVKRAVGYIHRMLLAAYAANQDEVVRLLSESRLMGIEIISDFIYTAFCIAFVRFEPDQVASIQTLDLTGVFPTVNEMDFCYCYGPYTDAVIGFFEDGKLRPHKLPPKLLVQRPGQPHPAVEDVRPVLSVLADSGCQFPDRRARLAYELPEGVYRRFRCLAGMAPAASFKPDKALRGNVSAKVLGDGKVLFARPSVFGDEAAVEVDLPISGVKMLELLVTNLYTKPDQFWLGQFVWAQPTLTK
jgi:hypothetical protein